MSILITGFEPFGGSDINPSWEAVRLLPDVVEGVEIARLRLPVIYGEAARLALEEARRLKADAVLCTGVASGRNAVTPELLAINWRMASLPDAAGVCYEGERIASDQPAALMTSLPVKDMVRAIGAEGVPARLSLSAGAYVCNDLYWHMLLSEQQSGCPALFVHVPDMETVSAESAARALTTCIAVLARTMRK